MRAVHSGNCSSIKCGLIKGCLCVWEVGWGQLIAKNECGKSHNVKSRRLYSRLKVWKVKRYYQRFLSKKVTKFEIQNNEQYKKKKKIIKKLWFGAKMKKIGVRFNLLHETTLKNETKYMKKGFQTLTTGRTNDPREKGKKEKLSLIFQIPVWREVVGVSTGRYTMAHGRGKINRQKQTEK